MFSKLSKDFQKFLVFMIMLITLAGTGALVFILLEEKRYDEVMIVSTVVPSIIFCISSWLYLRINWVSPDVFASNSI
jgi:hypothetical protein